MYFYYVWVRSNRYHGSEPLTYASEEPLLTGTIVQVELQRETVLGVVSGQADEPRFKTKPISRVFNVPALPTHLLKLADWLRTYYPAPLGIITQQLIPAGFSEKQLVKPIEPNIEQLPNVDLPPLTQDQQAALEAMETRETYLLHGTTGSGKTRLYIELAQRVVQSGKSVIILTPEISLTSQLAENFRTVFGQRVLVIHSQQTPSERQSAWLASARAKLPIIMIGPRSALFCPLHELGLIILDEAHESAYKQEQAPQYQTGRVASYLAQLTRSTLVLGSATPSVSDYYLAEQKQKPIISLTQLARGTPLLPTKLEIIDRTDSSLFSRSPYLSTPLLKSIETSLKQGEQSLLYLNRRGTARMVLCENCGWQADCPHCDVPLTYHGDSHNLRCHSCDYTAPAPVSCPSCNHANIIFKTAGTKAIVEETQRLFPQARIARFDTDNSRAERFERQYEAIKQGQVDILVGTQLLAKGLDLPKLSTLGIVLADTSLYMPDFSASERTFQLINQVLGRIGRGHAAGRAFIQTYHPEHPALRDAIDNNYRRFYERELAERQQFLFPPFCYLLKLSVRRASSRAAELAAEKLKQTLTESSLPVRVEGPAPAFYERFQGKYQWQVIVKASDRSQLLKIIHTLPANTSYDIDPIDLL